MIFTALSGDAASPRRAPLAYVLQIDDVKILLDCGAPDWCPESAADVEWSNYCAALERAAPSIDLVLLSHGDLSHLGLYAYAHARWGLNAPTYSSLPVQALGKLAVTEEAENIRASQDVDKTSTPAEDNPGQETLETKNTPRPLIATIKEVGTAFDSITPLRYSQPTHLAGKCQGLTITAYGAGHTLGGTLWKIRSASSGTILYAVHLNHMKERHLEGTALLKGGRAGGAGGSVVFEPLARPDLFITDAERTLMTVPRRKDRDAVFLETITSTLEDARKSVLIPCDASTRILELLLMLDQHWQFANLRVPICLVSRTGKEMINLVRSLVEWMGGNRIEEDETGATTLKLRHLEFFATPTSFLQAFPLDVPNPKPVLILTVPASLSHGPSRTLFTGFAQVTGNLLVLPSQGEPGSLARKLYSQWLASPKNGLQGNANTNTDMAKVGEPVEFVGEVLHLSMHSQVPLEGEELEAHLARERAAREREAASQAALARSTRLLEADEGDESSSDSDSDDESRDGDAGDAMNLDNDIAGGGGGGGGGGAGMDWSLLDAVDESQQARAQQLSFDIFLKNNTVSRTTNSFFKGAAGVISGEGNASSEDQQQQSGELTGGGGLTRFRMFPMVERRRRVDGYGETLDVGAWMRKGKALEEESKTVTGLVDKTAVADGEDVVAPEANVPSKFIIEVVEVSLACQTFYVDMEGLNDGRAVKSIVPQVNPRKMIIVNASEEASTALVASCGSIRAMTKEIYHPIAGESLQIGQQTNTYSISLSDQVLENVIMSRFEDNQVGYIHGRISMSEGSSIPLLDAAPLAAPNSHGSHLITSSSQNSATPPMPKALAPRIPSSLPRSTIIGDLKLTVLKARLSALGISAEFAGEGVLVCSGGSGGMAAEDSVAVKKTGRGQVVLEGAPSGVYYTVRQEVYGLHAVVAS